MTYEEMEDAIVTRLREAFKNASNVVTMDVALVPDTSDEQTVLGQKGCVLVAYGGSVYSEPEPSARAPKFRQWETLQFTCLVGSKSFARKGAHSVTLGPLQLVRSTLKGFRLGENPETDPVLYPTSNGYVKQKDKVFWYQITFQARQALS